MPRHAKNSTALPFFTHSEREKLKYGTKKERLGRVSKLDFDACYLCLSMAIDPVMCPKGHLTCRGCIYESLLQQKKEIKRQQDAFDHQTRETREKEEQEKEQEKAHAILKFESEQTSLVPEKSSLVAINNTGMVREDGKTVRDVSIKRIYPLEDPQATKETDNKGHAGSKADDKSMVAFWIPGLTPSAAATRVTQPIDKTYCLATNPRHALKLKQLTAVKFTAANNHSAVEAKYQDRNERWMCPGCIKTLTNNAKLTVLKKCGHVFCKKCSSDLIVPAKQCSVCSLVVAPNEIVELQTE
eukprot:Ihof_evm3s462 gene=Ihof_evmTU3s462